VEIARAINEVIKAKGGVSLVSDFQTEVLPLPVAGLMSSDEAHIVAENYEQLDRVAKSLGSHLNAPYMTLSFMALLVIPELKLSDLGLFDGNSFCFTDINH
jgi:adenine deaminase